MFSTHDENGLELSISLSQSDVEAATILLARLLGVNPTSAKLVIDKIRANGDPSREVIVQRAERIRLHRLRRAEVFPQPIFGEPPWEMLLSLFVDYPEQGATIAELAASAGLPSTTAARWLGYLEDHGLVQRKRHPADRRSRLVELTESARASLTTYFAEIDIS